MVEAGNSLLGKGMYTVPEAASLAGIPVAALRRWSLGYRYKRDADVKHSPAVWDREIEDIDGQVVLSFLDLMEARFVRAFRKHRVSWTAIRTAAKEAADLFGDSHPFTRRRFRTDGQRIFAEIERRGEVKLFDLNRRGWVFQQIVDPSLYRGVEFENDQAARWFPLYPKKTIVVDPARCFGRPVTMEGIPTDTLAAAMSGMGGDAAATAAWYNVPTATVRAAAAFESRQAVQAVLAEAA
jgi:uncharacterized protein (DUF433 family)